jgi:hypothetical protein
MIVQLLFYCSIVQVALAFKFLAIPSRRLAETRSCCQCIQEVFQLEFTVAESEFQLECHWLSVTVQCVTVQCVTLSRRRAD